MNSKRIDYGEDWNDPQVKQFTDLHWLPISKEIPQTATITLVRNRFHDSNSLLDTIIPFSPGAGYTDFISVPKDKIRSEPYMSPVTNTKVVSTIEFEVSDDLYVEVKDSFFLIDGLALIGGFLALNIAVFSYIFSLFMPWLMHLRIIQGLFRVDPARGKKPKSAAKMNSRKNEDLLEDAKNAMKRRVPLS